MAKKGIFEKYQILIVGGIGIVALLFIASSGMLAGIFNFQSFLQGGALTPLPGEITTEYMSYNVAVDIQPNPVCLGDDITATINTNIPNGVCSIFVDPGTGYFLLGNVNLDASGNFTTTETMTAAGTATVLTICCDAEGNCRFSNETTLVVTTAIPPCPTGPAPPPGPDSDGDGFTDEEEEAADTNPYDPNDYPGSDGFPDGDGTDGYTCGVYTTCLGSCPEGYDCFEIQSDDWTWCACLSGTAVHPDWKPDGVYYNPWPR